MEFTATELDYTLGALALLERNSNNPLAKGNINALMRKILYYSWQADSSVVDRKTISHYAKFCNFNPETYE